MASTIVALPTEVVDAVTVYLGLADLCSLRLVCSEISSKIDGGRLKAYYKRKTVSLTPGHLERLCENTAEGKLGCLLEELILVGPLRPDNWENGTDTKLVNAFSKLKRAIKHGRLRSLVLQVNTRAELSWVPFAMAFARPVDSTSTPDPWRQVCNSAQMTARMAVAGVAASGLFIEALDVFDSLARCSLTLDTVAGSIGVARAAPAFRALRSLSLSLSDDTDGLGNSRTMQMYSGDVARVLMQCVQLESLTLHWFKLARSRASEQEESKRHFFDMCQVDVQLPKLHSLRLRGIRCKEATLLQFLQRHDIQYLVLEELHLGEDGSFRTIFDHLCGKLEYISLSDLWTDRLVRFRNPPFPGPSNSGVFLRHSPVSDTSDGGSDNNGHQENGGDSDDGTSSDSDLHDTGLTSDTGPERYGGPSFLVRKGDYAKKPIHISTIVVQQSGELGNLQNAQMRRFKYGPLY